MTRLALWIGAALLATAVIWCVRATDSDREGLPDVDDSRPAAPETLVRNTETPPLDTARAEVAADALELVAGETTSIPVGSLPKGRPLVLHLVVPVALPVMDALPARIVAMDDGRELKLSDAAVAAARDRVSVEIDAGWLAPGRYLIEIQTTELSHFALRRYLLEIL